LNARGWLAPDAELPDDAVIAAALMHTEPLVSTCISTLEPWRKQIANWYAADIQGTTMHATLARNHGYTGSVSAVYRFLHQLVVDDVNVGPGGQCHTRTSRQHWTVRPGMALSLLRTTLFGCN
jgi:hypothetical protein